MTAAIALEHMLVAVIAHVNVVQSLILKMNRNELRSEGRSCEATYLEGHAAMVALESPRDLFPSHTERVQLSKIGSLEEVQVVISAERRERLPNGFDDCCRHSDGWCFGSRRHRHLGIFLKEGDLLIGKWTTPALLYNFMISETNLHCVLVLAVFAAVGALSLKALTNLVQFESLNLPPRLLGFVSGS